MEGRSGKKQMKPFRIRGLAVACIILAIAIGWGYQVYSINKSIPQTKVRVKDGDKWNSWKNKIQFKISGMDFMEDADIRKAVASKEILYDYKMKILWADIQLKNEGSKEQMVDLLDMGAESDGWCNIPDVQLYEALGNTEKPLKFVLKPKETAVYRLPYLLLAANFRTTEWEKTEQKKYYITLFLYPEKKMYRMNEKENNSYQ